MKVRWHGVRGGWEEPGTADKGRESLFTTTVMAGSPVIGWARSGRGRWRGKNVRWFFSRFFMISFSRYLLLFFISFFHLYLFYFVLIHYLIIFFLFYYFFSFFSLGGRGFRSLFFPVLSLFVFAYLGGFCCFFCLFRFCFLIYRLTCFLRFKGLIFLVRFLTIFLFCFIFVLFFLFFFIVPLEYLNVIFKRSSFLHRF